MYINYEVIVNDLPLLALQEICPEIDWIIRISKLNQSTIVIDK